jgi:response regulator RpfG family c-di-GMP phosphodiesterase
MTRLLLVDGSDLTGWLVAHLIPCSVEIVRAGSFAEADRFLCEEPPDAAIFNLTPRHLDWRALLSRCLHHEPVIPYLCCSAIENDEERDGPLPCRPEDYFTKSISQAEFRTLLERLCAESRARGRERFSGRGARRGAPEDRKLDRTPA